MPYNPCVAPATNTLPAHPGVGSTLPKRELYAVALEIQDRQTKRWRPEIRYTHAVHPAAAKFEVLRGYDFHRETIRVVSVAVVIGYKVLDKKGLILGV